MTRRDVGKAASMKGHHPPDRPEPEQSPENADCERPRLAGLGSTFVIPCGSPIYKPSKSPCPAIGNRSRLSRQGGAGDTLLSMGGCSREPRTGAQAMPLATP